MKHLLSIDDLAPADIDQLLRLTDAFVEVSRRSIPKVPALRGQERGLALLRGLHPHPPQLRAGGQAALGRHDELQRRLVVGEEGRVAPRHRADHRGDGRRRHRRAPRLGRRAVADRPLARRPCARGQRRRRLARAPHPGAARQLHDPRAPRARSRGSTSGSSATSSTAASPAPTSWPSRRSAPRSPSSRRRRCCRPASTAGRSA